MKKTANLLLASSMFLIALASCKKESPVVNSASSTPALKIMSGVDTGFHPIIDAPGNPGNPYDSIGLKHNTTADNTRSTWDIENPVQMNICVAVREALGLSAGTTEEDETLIGESNDVINDGVNNYDNVISAMTVSSDAKNYLTRIKAIGYNVTTTTTYSQFKSDVINVETEVLNSTKLSVNDKAVVLKSASIARYSTKYWVNEIYTQEYQPGHPPAASLYFLRGLGRAIRTIYADYCASGTADHLGMDDATATAYVTMTSLAAYQ